MRAVLLVFLTIFLSQSAGAVQHGVGAEFYAGPNFLGSYDLRVLSMVRLNSAVGGSNENFIAKGGAIIDILPLLPISPYIGVEYWHVSATKIRNAISESSAALPFGIGLHILRTISLGIGITFINRGAVGHAHAKLFF